MKLKTIGIAGISTLFSLAVISTAIAAVPGDGNRRPAFEGGRGGGPGAGAGRTGRRGGAAPARQLRRMDADDDGQISEDEFVDFRLANIDDLFERLDHNDDGLISLEENQRPERPDPPNRPELRDEVIACVRETMGDFAPNADMDIEERFESIDTDGSGSLALAELSAALEERAHEAFARIDADADGFVTEDELRANRQARRDERQEVRECVREAAQA